MAFQSSTSFNTSAKDVIIYTRISTLRNNTAADSNRNNQTQSVSLETQYFACKNYCDSKNYNIIQNISDISSAYNKVPTNLKRLISESNKGLHIVIYAIDRFSRNTDIGFQLLKMAKKYNIIIEFVADGFTNENDRHILQIKGGILHAEHESRIIGTRIKARNAVKRSVGWKFGNAKYGYKIVFLGGIRKQVENQYEQKVIKFIKYISNDYDLETLNQLLQDIKPTSEKISVYDSNGDEVNEDIYDAQPAKKIAELLNSYSIYDRNNKPWVARSIKRIIQQNCVSINDLMAINNMSI
jgi:DNA invertase Pin-like site-specific DNA recombinase